MAHFLEMTQTWNPPLINTNTPEKAKSLHSNITSGNLHFTINTTLIFDKRWLANYVWDVLLPDFEGDILWMEEDHVPTYVRTFTSETFQPTVSTGSVQIYSVPQ
jgi:hypothetical protein